MDQNREKPFTTIEDQIDLLRSRNLIILDENEAKMFLLRESYYAVVNGYKEPFIDQQKSNELNEDYFSDYTSFNHLMILYKFDRLLRRTTMQFPMDAEAIMKSSTVYAFCYYNREKDAYLDQASYCSSDDYFLKSTITRI